MKVLAAVRTVYLFLTLSLPVFLILACNDNDTSAARDSTREALASDSTSDSSRRAMAAVKPLATSDDIQTLYVENSSTNQQLMKLLNDNAKQKLLFQVYRDGGGNVRIVIIPCQGSSQHYFLDDTIRPKLSGIKQAQFPGNDDVLLGQLQLANHGNDKPLDPIKANIGNPRFDPEWKYIWFVPEIMSVPYNEDQNQSSSLQRFLIYHILHSNEPPKVLERIPRTNQPYSIKGVTPIGLPNPSPPATMQ